MTDPLSAPADDQGLRCLECDYNLTGIDSARCPECGAELDWGHVRRVAAERRLGLPPWELADAGRRIRAFVRTVWLATAEAGPFASRIPVVVSEGAAGRYLLWCWLLASAAGAAAEGLDCWLRPGVPAVGDTAALILGVCWVTLPVMLGVRRTTAGYVRPAGLTFFEDAATRRVWRAILSYQSAWFVPVVPGAVMSGSSHVVLSWAGPVLLTVGAFGWWFCIGWSIFARRHGFGVDLVRTATVPLAAFVGVVLGGFVGVVSLAVVLGAFVKVL